MCLQLWHHTNNNKRALESQKMADAKSPPAYYSGLHFLSLFGGIAFPNKVTLGSFLPSMFCVVKLPNNCDQTNTIVIKLNLPCTLLIIASRVTPCYLANMIQSKLIGKNSNGD